MSMRLKVRVRSIAIAFAVIANGVAFAQAPPTPQVTPKRVRVVFDEQEIKDPLRARMYQLIAEGDSWFDYPGLDVLSALSGGKLASGLRYKVYSAPSAGDTVESMACGRNQREGFGGIRR